MKSSSSGWVRTLALVAFIVAAPSALAQVEPTDAICRSVREEKPKLKIRVHKVSEGTPAGFQITVAEYDENGDISFKDHRTGTGFLNVSIVKIDFNDVQIGTGELEASSNGESIGVYRPGKVGQHARNIKCELADARLRPEIIPSFGRQAGNLPVPGFPNMPVNVNTPSANHAEVPPPAAPAPMSWARLLKRVFKIDMEHCSQCGGTLTLIAAVEHPPVIAKILVCLCSMILYCCLDVVDR